jgi:hypothetical protein
MTKTAWILIPQNHFEKEARFVAYFQSEFNFFKKWEKEMSKIDTNYSHKTKDQLVSVLKFKEGLTSLLIDRGYTIPQMSNLRELLKSMNEERKYLYYILLSEYTHFSHHATGIYQKNLGILKTFEETPNLDLWKLVFSSSWPIFELTTEFFMKSLGYQSEVYSKKMKSDIRKAIESID